MSTKKAAVKRVAKPKEALPALQTRKIIVNGPHRQVFIIDDADKLTDVDSLQCISLMHPKHGKPCRYLHTSTHLWELQRVYQAPSSWFIGHSVQEDGSLYFATLIDPLFVVLPMLDRARKKTAESEGNFMQLDQLLPKSDFPSVLLPSLLTSLHHICDKRDGWNAPVWRLSDSKVHVWLGKKAQRMMHRFKQIKCLSHLYSDAERKTDSNTNMAPAASDAAAATAVPAAATGETEEKKDPAPDAAASSTSAAAVPAGDDAAASAAAAAAATAASPAAPSSPAVVKSVPSASHKQSLQFLSEYLSAPTFLAFLTSQGWALEDVFERKRAASKWEGGGGKISGDIDTSRPAGGAATNTAEKRKSDKPISSAAKKLATAAKGTKSLASFFTKKAP